MKKVLLFLLCLIIFTDHADARRRRRHRRHKGTVIVNQILKLTGTLSIDGKPVPEYSGVKEGNLLETGEQSFAVIRIPGLGIYRLNPQTQLKLTKFNNRDITKMELLKGEVLFIYKRLGKHEIFSPRAKISPTGNFRSNTFFVSSLTDDDEVSLWDGKIEAASRQAQKEDKLIAAKPMASASPAPTPASSPEEVLQASGVFTTKENYLIINVDESSVEEAKDSESTLPDIRTMQELESLYALP